MTPRFARLHGAGTEVLLDLRGAGLPRIAHWGADLGELSDVEALIDLSSPPVRYGAPDQPPPLTVLPLPVDAWRGRPALAGSRGELDGSRGGRDYSPLFADVTVSVADTDVRVVASGNGLELNWSAALTPHGVLRLVASVTNTGAEPYRLDELGLVLPVPADATEVFDLTGRWSGERQPQRHDLPFGCWLREGRHGRTGHDSPLLVCVGRPGFSFRNGEVRGVHLAWSGDSRYWAQRLPEGRSVLGAAELLAPGEVILEPGEAYQTPELLAVHSDYGLDGLADRLHDMLRSRPRHPHRRRPVVLNTWEAVYFDQSLATLTALADRAARVGVERFVLDDGWFRGRTSDQSSLGDWYVDPQRWPAGLRPLVDHVRGLGLEFGLWVEPEMISPDSDLCRAHPDWVLGPGDRRPASWRHQQVLDLVNPEAYEYVLSRLDSLIREYTVDYLKWDHNRDLDEPGHDGRPATHRQTLATYRLLDELRYRHPQLEIETCASGGGRVDLGILARTDRIWASDSNDALERQSIQRYTGLLLPPELVGAHIGAPTAHQSGRALDLSFRFATAAFGHLGLEWDLAQVSESTLEVLGSAIAWWKSVRELIHTGRTVHVDHPDPAALAHGVVSASRALYCYAQLSAPRAEVPGRLRLPGLAPRREYRLRPVHPAGAPRTAGPALSGFWLNGTARLTGAALERVGLELPVLAPQQALLLELSAV